VTLCSISTGHLVSTRKEVNAVDFTVKSILVTGQTQLETSF